MTKKIFALTLAFVMLLSSQVAMAAPTAPTTSNLGTVQASSIDKVEVQLKVRVGEGRKLSGYGFRPGGGDSSSYFLDVDGNFLALKPGQGSIIASLTPDRLIIYYFTITN
ncbi:hypothetical protein ACE3MS_00550 [Paenibacillus dendritiformis]|uniref:hypothetical protein n=1 Tax=Paenibacillus dendritiformis TaxID=130049 RepID=UPI00365223FD